LGNPSTLSFQFKIGICFFWGPMQCITDLFLLLETESIWSFIAV
jgi:hypothetical protein